MPPPMSSNNDVEPLLTNDEIYILYDIVQRAQRLPDSPYRALFTAYDQIRAERGKLEDGSRCLTFLLRMQEDSAKEEESLMSTFQRLLLEMGFEVEEDSEGEGVEVTESQLDVAPQNVQPDKRRMLARGPSRRGSFDSFFDGAGDKVAGIDSGQDVSSRTRRGSAAAVGAEERQKRRSRSDTDTKAGSLGPLPFRARKNGTGNNRSASEHVPTRQRRSMSMSSRGSLRIRRNGHEADTQELSDYDGDDSQGTDSFDRSHVQIPGVNAPIPGADDFREAQRAIANMVYRPTDTQVMRDAQNFNNHRILASTRTLLQRWRDRTQDRLQTHDSMDTAAIAFDRTVLLRASLESWRVAFQNQQAAIETDRFFERLEIRAGKARKLFLLTKAFTHWAKSAEDEVQRTSVARRHIIRTKYFNAWRDITVVNELKIQQFMLGNFLRKWRARTATVQEREELAVDLYQDNIIVKSYWKWFHALANRRAPFYHNRKLAADYLHKWVEVARATKEREEFESYRHNRNLLRRTLEQIQQKAVDIRLSETQAENSRRIKLLASAFSMLRRQAQLQPLAIAVQETVSERNLRSMLLKWRRNTQLSLQARMVDRQRILSNAFTRWNDALRINELKGRIDDRVVVESLYKWVLASRMSLIQRVRNHSQKLSIFQSWIAKVQDRETRLENAERRFAQYKRTQLLDIGLRKLENAIILRRNQEYLAHSIIEPKIKQHAFSILLAKQRHHHQLNDWASRAQYYITTKHAIQTWQRATEFARRERRREAYARFRRDLKLKLVRRTLTLWRDKTNQVRVQQWQADEKCDNRLLRVGLDILIRWRDRASTIHAAEQRAELQYHDKITSASFNTWSMKSQILQNMETQASALRQESTEITAASCIKKLGWRLWTVERQEDNAKKLHERNFEKHVHAMIRFWLEQTNTRIAARPMSPTPGSRTDRRRDDGRINADWDSQGGNLGREDGDAEDNDGNGDLGDAGDETRGLEAWTAFDENALGLSNLDLSLSVSPSQHPRPHRIPTQSLSSLPLRPATHPQAQSVSRPPPVIEMPDLEDEDEAEFWASTPMPLSARPGYLKTPSKRSVARAKRPELPPSPEKRSILPAIIERRGLASAPPVPGYMSRESGPERGVTSFERRLMEGGFAASSAGGLRSSMKSRIRGKGRVGFGDLGPR